MREKFWGYFPLTEQDFEEILNDSYIIMDTNILLNFYRYSKDTKDKLMEILGNKKDRLFLLEIVLKEFFRNRYSAINDHCKGIEELKNKIGFKKIKNEINSFRHINLDKENLINIIEDFENKLNDEFKKCDIIDFKKDDPILNEIMSLFNNDIIPDFEVEKKKDESKIAEVRFDKKIPPGYKDKDKDDMNDKFPKDEYRRYNDYFIWKQIMDFAKEKGKNIIFVTDDVKEDWFRRNGGETRGPREELLNEFYKETKQKIYIYNTNGFFNAMDKEKLTSDMVEEINEVSALDEEPSQYKNYLFKNDIIGYNIDEMSLSKLIQEKMMLEKELKEFVESWHDLTWIMESGEGDPDYDEVLDNMKIIDRNIHENRKKIDLLNLRIRELI